MDEKIPKNAKQDAKEKKKRQNKMPKKTRGNKRITRHLFKKKQTPEKP